MSLSTLSLHRIAFRALTLTLCLTPGMPATDAVRWTFDGGTAEGWSAAHSLSSFTVSAGILRTTITGFDAYMVGPGVAFDAARFQYVQLRVRSLAAGGGQVFFSSSASPGIGADDAVSYSLPGGGSFHRLHVYMGGNRNWAGSIDRIRVDFPEAMGKDVEIDSIAVIDQLPRPEWFFQEDGNTGGWNPNPNFTVPAVAAGVLATGVEDGGASDPWLDAPAVELDGDRDRLLTVRMAVEGALADDSAQVYFTTSASPAWGEDKVVVFPIGTDGAFHAYTVDLKRNALWTGTITAFRFDPVSSNARPTRVRIDAIAFDHRWEFEEGDPGGWTAENGLAPLSVSAAGRLETRATGQDPRLGAPIAADAAVYPDLEIEMAVAAASPCAGQVFFETRETPLSASTSVAFTPICDGKMRRYIVPLDSNGLWRGVATRLRIDPVPLAAFTREVPISFNAVRLRGRSGAVEIARFAPRRELNFRGEDVELLLRLRHAGTIGSGPVEAALAVPAGLTALDGVARSLPDLAPGESRELTFRLRGDAVGAHPLDVRVTTAVESRAASRVVRVVNPPPAMGPIAPAAELIVAADRSSVLLKNPRLALVVVRDGLDGAAGGFGYGLLLATKSGAYADAAALEPLGRVVEGISGSRVEWDFRPTALQVLPSIPGEASVRLSGTSTGQGSGTWSYSITLSLKRDDQEVLARWEASSSMPRSLLHLRGPWLRPGERNQGPMESAVLPGLEWLDDGETSSSELDIRGAESVRRVPHPLKVAVGAPSITVGGVAAGLLWDPLREWTPGKRLPSAVFDVPDRLEDRESHLIGLFAPSVPENVLENTLEAFQPFSLGAGQTVSLEARLYAAATSTPAAAVSRWLEIHPPGAPPAPRSDLDSLRLSLDGYGQTLWDPAAKGWGHALQFQGRQPYPPMIADMLYGVAIDPSGPNATAYATQAREALAKALGEFGPGGLLSENGVHLLGWELPFLVGHVDDGVQALLGRLAGIRAAQAADGSWSFQGDQQLGERGAVELGTCAHNAWVLLKGARITGDPAALAAGLRALERMKAFEVPRAAQTWEVPVHTPDILAAAHASLASLEAFRSTGAPAHLDEAVRRAREGLPFLYDWGAPGIEVMPFASIPVFGATFYTGSWLGRPVQWCGLVHAYALLDLAGTLARGGDPRAGFFRQVALGVTRSALHQQYTSGPSRGLYPDSWVLAVDAPSPADINPNSILRCSWLLQDRGLEVETALIAGPNGSTIRVSSVPGPTRAVRDAEGVISLTFRLRAGLASFILVTGTSSPRDVQADGAPLEKLGDVDQAAPGEGVWMFRAGVGTVIKLPAGAERTVTITMREVPRRFVRGDANSDGTVDISDALFTLFRLFAGGRTPACDDALDAGDNGALGIDDAIVILGYLFRSGSPPGAPFPGCGSDPTPDGVGCERATARC